MMIMDPPFLGLGNATLVKGIDMEQRKRVETIIVLHQVRRRERIKWDIVMDVVHFITQLSTRSLELVFAVNTQKNYESSLKH